MTKAMREKTFRAIVVALIHIGFLVILLHIAMYIGKHRAYEQIRMECDEFGVIQMQNNGADGSISYMCVRRGEDL